jgi:hypothetical protein
VKNEKGTGFIFSVIPGGITEKINPVPFSSAKIPTATKGTGACIPASSA